MLESFLAWSSLPNLHPVLVHFPLALLPLAASLDLLVLISARRKFDQAAVGLYALGTGLGWWAAEVGEDAAESFVDLPAVIEPEIAEHSDMAHYALYVFAFVLAVRVVLAFRDRASERVTSRGVRLGALLVAAAGFFFLFETAEHGGALVFRHGLAVSSDAVMFEKASAGPEAPEPEAEQVAESPAARLLEGDDGSLTWTPVASDSGALGRVLFPVAGFPRGAVEIERIESSEPGLSLTVLDRTMLVFGSDFGDVRVEAELALDDFTGTAGVAHHVRSAEAASWFEVSTGGAAALRLSQGGSILTLEEAEIDALTGPVRLAVSVVDGDRKGSVNGTVVVHGHIAGSGDPDRVGLLLDGSGQVVIRRVSVEPYVPSP